MQTSAMTSLRAAAPARARARAGPRRAGTARAARAPLRVAAFKEGEEERQARRERSPQDAGAAVAIPAFTRRRERAVGRIASLGVAAAWAGEQARARRGRALSLNCGAVHLFTHPPIHPPTTAQITGAGPLTQVALELGVPMFAVSAASPLTPTDERTKQPTGTDRPQLAKKKTQVYASTGALAFSQLLLGTSLSSPTWTDANQRDVDKRTKGFTGISEARGCCVGDSCLRASAAPRVHPLFPF
jgi:hypothetical protein